MNGPRAARTGACAVAFAVLIVVVAPLTASGAAPCTRDGVRSIVVRITEPSDGAQVSGPVVVEGTASSLVPIRRLELNVDDQTLAVTETDERDVSFRFVWDAAKHPIGAATVQVKACGTGDAAPWGMAVIDTEVIPVVSEPVTAKEAPAIGAVAQPTAPTTPAAVPDRTAAAPASTAAVEPTAVPASVKPKPTAKALTSRPVALWSRLGESAEPEPAGAPVWVGAVVGVAGLAGLAYAIVGQSRRRSRDGIVVAEPVSDDPDPAVRR